MADRDRGPAPPGRDHRGGPHHLRRPPGGVYAAPIAREDDELVRAAQGGDRGALEQLLTAHHPRIYALARRITGSDADADDAAQEALLAIVRGLPRFDGRAAFSTWAYRVATNACLDELRRRRRRPTPVDAEAGFAGEAGRAGDDGTGGDGGTAEGSGGRAAGGGGPGVGDSVADRVTIDDALAELRPELRAAVVLRDLVGLDYAQIAEVLEVPAGTVRSRISRGRAALAARIGNPAADRDVRTEAP